MSGERLAVASFAVLLGAAFALHGWRPRPALGLVGLVAAGIAALLGVRWVTSGHPPIFGTFETNLAEAACLLLSTFRVRRLVGPSYLRGPVVVALALLGHSLLVRHEATPLTISERSLWIDLHAPLAWVALCAYVHGGLLAFRGEPAAGPALRLLGLGFVAQTAMGFAGVYYATILFATPWSWDPVQTLGLLAWLLAAVALHLRLFFHAPLWRQRGLVVIVVVAYLLSAKALIYLRPGQSFHVFELGAMTDEPGGEP